MVTQTLFCPLVPPVHCYCPLCHGQTQGRRGHDHSKAVDLSGQLPDPQHTSPTAQRTLCGALGKPLPFHSEPAELEMVVTAACSGKMAGVMPGTGS